MAGISNPLEISRPSASELVSSEDEGWDSPVTPNVTDRPCGRARQQTAVCGTDSVRIDGQSLAGRQLLANASFDDRNNMGDCHLQNIANVCLPGREGEGAARSLCERIKKGLLG